MTVRGYIRRLGARARPDFFNVPAFQKNGLATAGPSLRFREEERGRDGGDLPDLLSAALIVAPLLTTRPRLTATPCCFYRQHERIEVS